MSETMSEDHDRFDFPDRLIRFQFGLPHLAHGLRHSGPIKIVAIGSEETAGESKIVPYPERLQLLLRERFPNREIEVLNKGVAGEDAPEELSRFDRDIVAERPMLAIWQVGTNAVFRHQDHNLDDVASSITKGLDILAGLPLDVVLIDPPYTPALVASNGGRYAEAMVSLVRDVGAMVQVNVFARFALMRHWSAERMIPMEQLTDPDDPDRLDQSDASTEAVAQALSRAIAQAVMRNDDNIVVEDAAEAHEKADRTQNLDKPDIIPPSSENRPPWVDKSRERRVSLLFATTRERSKQPEDFFSGEREADITHYGRASVRVPEERNLGQIQLPFELKILTVTLFKQTTNPRKHFILEQCQTISKEEWLRTVQSSGQKEAMVFVHGFNVTFLEGIYRCAQIAWDIQYGGIPILFSWASRGLKREYPYDQGSALDARARFLELLCDLGDAGMTKIHVLAHSMGNYAVLDALATHDHRTRPLRLGEILMAAPDVDRDHYSKTVPKVRSVTNGMTLYASAADWTMVAAKTIAGSIPRAGDVPATGPILVDQVDSIDITAVGTDIFGLNHSTYADKKSVLNDVKLLLARGIKPPDERLAEITGMPEDVRPPKWWRYRP